MVLPFLLFGFFDGLRSYFFFRNWGAVSVTAYTLLGFFPCPFDLGEFFLPRFSPRLVLEKLYCSAWFFFQGCKNHFWGLGVGGA